MARVKYTSGVGKPWGSTKRQDKRNAEVRRLTNANWELQVKLAEATSKVDRLTAMLPGERELDALASIERLPYMTLVDLGVLDAMVKLVRWSRRIDIRTTGAKS